MARDAKLRRAKEFVVLMAAAPKVLAGTGDAILTIVGPADNLGMMRNLLTRARVVETAVFPSWRVGNVAVEGAEEGERNACWVLDADPTVRSYATQPLAVHYRLAGKTTWHIPDFKVQYQDHRKELWEVKSVADARRPEVNARTRFLQGALPEFGFSYRLVTHKELKAEPRLGTARTLWRYGFKPLDLLTRERVLNVIRQQGVVSWGAILRGALGPHGRDAVCRLTLEGDLFLDRTAPLEDSSVFAASLPAEVA